LPKSISEEMDFAELYLLESNVEVVVVRVSGLFILKYRIETSSEYYTRLKGLRHKMA
jgi:hypothetical protein